MKLSFLSFLFFLEVAKQKLNTNTISF